MNAFVVGSVLLLACSAYGAPWNHGPVDTPEVAAAKAAHFAAHAAVQHGHGAPAHVGHWDHHEAPVQKWHGPQHIPVIHKGVPVETPEVQHAKAAHAAAYAKVQGYGYGHESHQVLAHEDHHGPAYGAWHGPQHIPVIHNGVPVETPEVQHAKAFHLNALANAGSHYGGHYESAAQWDNGHEDDGSYKPQWESHNY